MPEQSSIKAILEAKCPKCREGDMFEFPLSHLRKFSRMHTHCPVCDLRFEVEPGFFIGAMYISYAMSLGIFFTVSVVIYVLFNNPEFYFYMIGIPSTVLILLPFMFRYSRVLFLYLFGGIKYDTRDRTII
jgi:uncharacterized protein (DUF983 family)